MQLFIYLSIALVAISSAQQLKNGPQILPEPSSSGPSQKVDKRYVAPEFNLYFTPEEIQELITMQSSPNSASSEILKQNPGVGEESYNELIQKFYAENIKPAPIKEPQVEQGHSSSKFFLPKEESIYNNKPNFNFNTYRQLLMDQSKLSRHVQNAQKNKSNQLAFFKPASDSNKNENQKKSVVEKEKEYILSNGKIYQLNSPITVPSQNSNSNIAQKNSAVEKEIESAWKQYLAHEFERLNSPVEITKQILSAKNKNQKKVEVEKPITYILGNDQAYGYEKFNAPTGVNNQGSQNINEEQSESEEEREIKDFWSKQQNSKLQTSSFPAEVFNQGPSGPSGVNENKEKSEVDKQIENIFKQQDFGFERAYLPSDVSLPLSKNKNLKNLKTEKQFEFILRNHETEFEKEIASEVNNQSPQFTNKNKNKSDVEKEIEDILKKHQDFELQKSRSTAEAINKSPPIKIHEHVSITKHIPVPVLKTVQVAVPTPVLVPIPQPYEVKVPHPYPVPLKVVKQVPVPLRHY